MSMIMTVTDAIISRGYDDQAAIRFNEKGDFVRFRFGSSKYDKSAPNNRRWINMSAKAFDTVCERIKKMQLREGAHVTLIGEYDEETWMDDNTKEQKSAPVLTLVYIEYAGSGGWNKQQGGNNNAQPQTDAGQQSPPGQSGVGQPAVSPAAPSAQNTTPGAGAPTQNDPQQMPESFEGFQSFGSENPYFSED